jgi:hypothetical protein
MAAEDQAELAGTPEAAGEHGVSVCATCVYKWAGAAKCFAFPGGIPYAILTGETGHDVMRPDLGQRNDLAWTSRAGRGWPIR